MNKTFEKIEVWVSTLLAKWNKDAKEQAEKREALAASEKIGVVVRFGKLYFAYNGQPLIESESLNKPIGDIVEEARITYITTNR